MRWIGRENRKRAIREKPEWMSESQAEFLLETLAILFGESTKGRVGRVLVVGALTAVGLFPKEAGPDVLIRLLGSLF